MHRGSYVALKQAGDDVIVHGGEVGLHAAPKRPIDLVPRVALALDKQGKPSRRD